LEEPMELALLMLTNALQGIQQGVWKFNTL